MVYRPADGGPAVRSFASCDTTLTTLSGSNVCDDAFSFTSKTLIKFVILNNVFYSEDIADFLTLIDP